MTQAALLALVVGTWSCSVDTGGNRHRAAQLVFGADRHGREIRPVGAVDRFTIEPEGEDLVWRDADPSIAVMKYGITFTGRNAMRLTANGIDHGIRGWMPVPGTAIYTCSRTK